MQHLQHNVVSLLYTIKSLAEVYLARAEDGRFTSGSEALMHAYELMKRIHRQVERALLITKRIRMAMKAAKEQGCDRTSRAEVSLGKTWRKVRRALRMRYVLCGLEVIERIPDEFPGIQCRPKDLLEILYSLSENAFQAMDGEGKLIIRANLEFGSGDEPVAVITLSDTGPGIPKESLSSLFAPFFTTKPLEEGNGLGLCLARSLVKRNSGKISVSSFQGCGTTFTVSFPVAKSTSSEPTARVA